MNESPCDDWKGEARDTALSCNGELLRQLRQSKGWTQAELAKVAGYGLRLITKAEAGDPISLTTIEDLAEALSTDDKIVYPEDIVIDPLLQTREMILLLQHLRPNAMGDMQHWLDEHVQLHVVGHRKVRSCPSVSVGREDVLSVLEFLWIEFGGEPLTLEDVHCVSSGSEVAIWSKLYGGATQGDTHGGVQTGCLLEFRRGRIFRIELMLDSAAWQARMVARKQSEK